MRITGTRKGWRLSYERQLRAFLIPYLAGSAVLTVLPALATAFIAFTRFNAIQEPIWIGLDNFRRLFASPLVQLSLRNSLIFLGCSVPLRLLGALVCALLLQPDRRLYGLYRASVFVPAIIPRAAYALMWLWILNPLYGPLNLFLGLLGLPAPDWLVEPGTAQAAMILVSLSQIGEGFVVLLAGLRNIPRTFYEAAKVDGASAWQAFWMITIPLLAPWLLLLTFRDLIVSLENSFTPSFVITYGGPYYATTYVPLLIYELSFDFFDLGLAAALLMLVYVLVALVVLGVLNLVGLGWGTSDV